MQFSPLLLILFLLVPLKQVASQSSDYVEKAQKMGLDFIWPTNASHELTSTFAEFRPTHYHYGIDIKTWNQIGYDVYSAEEGYISRIRVSPTGYGKAVYITHKGGYVTVYAHLDGFAGKVKQFVLDKHYELMRNEINIFLNPKDLPVKKGELVAYTGETGIGTPHLHFEIRDPAGNELNPLRLQKGQFQDTNPPLITGFAIKPLSFSGQVNNSFEPAVYKEFKKQSPGFLELNDIPIITEKAGFLIDGYDMSSGKSNKYGFHQIQLWIDGKQHYQVTYDQFPVEEARYILIDRDPEFIREGMGRFTRLFEAEPNPLVIYKKYSDQNGRIAGLNPGLHTGKVVVSDLYGNKVELNFKFEFKTRPESLPSGFLAVNEKKNFSLPEFSATVPDREPPLIWFPVTGGNGNLEKQDFDTIFVNREDDLVRLEIRGKTVLGKDFRIALLQGNQSLVPVQAVNGTKSVFIDYQVQSLPVPQFFAVKLMNNSNKLISEKKWQFVFINNTNKINVNLASGNQVVFDQGNLFAPQWITLAETGLNSGFSDYRLELGPGSVPFYTSPEVRLKKGTETKFGAGVYRFYGKYSSFIGNKTVDGYLASDVSSPGVFGYGQDTLPTILIQKSGSGNRITGKKIEFKIKDAGSGLNTASIKVLINNQWCLAEFDPEKATLKVYTDRVRPASDYLVVLSLEDKTGNRTTEKFNWKGRG